MRHKVRRAIVGVLAVVALGAGASSAGAGGDITSGATIKVALKEWKVISSAKTCVPRGKIIFVVRNVGSLEHELVVLRTNRLPRRLPTKGSQAVETGLQGKTPDLRPGQTRRLTLRLRPGKYVLLCNLPGHYKAGQFAGLCVR